MDFPEDRKAIIKRLRIGESVSQVAKDYKVSRGTIITIRESDSEIVGL